MIGTLHRPQPAGHVLVERQHAFARVDDEQNHVGRVDRQVDLVFDVPREVVHVGDAHAAGVDQLEEAVVVTHQVRDAVARDARLVVDDGNPHAGEPIQHAALADVGPADDDDLRNAHRRLDQTRATAIRRRREARRDTGSPTASHSYEYRRTEIIETAEPPTWFLANHHSSPARAGVVAGSGGNAQVLALQSVAKQLKILA